jgi:hypothetical protein
MADVQTNLRVLKRSRKKPLPGDVFAMQLPEQTFLFGRVVGAELEPPRAPMPLSYLIYVYGERSQSMQPVLDELRPDRLLLPPVFINRMPWTKGYFQTVAHRALSGDDLLSQHCFWDAARSRYVDEHQNVLPQEVQPCGVWGLSSYRWLDDQVSDALGIPRVPED